MWKTGGGEGRSREGVSGSSSCGSGPSPPAAKSECQRPNEAMNIVHRPATESLHLTYLHCSTVEKNCTAVQCSAVQWCAVQYSEVQCSTLQYSAV